MNLEEFITKMVKGVTDEKSELDAKMEKLNAYLTSPESKGADEYQTTMLNLQLYAMKSYSLVLEARINYIEA